MRLDTGEDLIFVDGIEVQMTRKDVRALRIRVKPDGQVAASVPRRMPQRQVEAFIRGKADWIAKQQRRAADSPMARADDADPAQVRQWRQAVEACVPALVAAWEPLMGVTAGSLAYRNMRSRWGSCQPATGRICINVRLALYPPECLEYVVVHELCHLIEPGHGSAFHALMDGFMPDWRDRRARLRA